MTARNPLRMAKELATHSLMAAVGAAGTAAGIVKGVAAAGRSAAGRPARPTDDGTAAESAGQGGEEPTEDAVAEPPTINPDEPVNVVEELGLDPAPVDRSGPRPATTIDAAADPDHVDATPADVADVVAPRPANNEGPTPLTEGPTP